MQAAGRTADIVPSIPVLAAQILSMVQLSEEKQTAEHPDTKEIMKLQFQPEVLGRFGTEEILRRMIKKDHQVLTGKQILDILMPERADMLEKYKHAYDSMLKQQAEASNKKGDDAYAAYAATAAQIR